MEILDDYRLGWDYIPRTIMPKSFLLHGRKKDSMDTLCHPGKESDQDKYLSDVSCPQSPCSDVSDSSNHSNSFSDDKHARASSSDLKEDRNSFFSASEGSAFNKIHRPELGVHVPPTSSSLRDLAPSLYTPGVFPPPCFPLYPSSVLGEEPGSIVAPHLSNPYSLHPPPISLTMKNGKDATASPDKNVYYYVDPRIPFTNYFLNLTKLLKKECSATTPLAKIGDDLRADDRDNPMTPDSKRKKCETVAMETKRRSPSPKAVDREDECHDYSVKGLTKERDALPVFPEHPMTSPFDSRLFHPSQQPPVLPLHGAGIYHPALLQFPAAGFRRFNSEKPPPVKKYKCDVCGKAFSRSNTLVTHKRIHTGDKPFKCELCGRAFRQPGNLTRHRLTHTTVKPYVCPTCNKAFNRASNLHTHMRTHTNFKPFVCPYCGKGFHQKIDMKIHCYTHTGERPHKCNICEKGFTLASTLNTHRRTHMDTDGEAYTRISSDDMLDRRSPTHPDDTE